MYFKQGEDAWEVLKLFLIPIGGGIPSGVLLARERGFSWPLMMLLYLISDVILACMLEPCVLLIAAWGRRVRFLSLFLDAFWKAMERTTQQYGHSLGPITLILVSFGVDPMTGRAAAAVAGYGFVRGWAVSIAGDMLYFVLIMVSALWLNHILGNEAQTTAVIRLAMLFLPSLIRKWKERNSTDRSERENNSPH